jgi:hypothetical protein
MTIDLTREPAIRLADVPKLPWLPRRRRGRRLHVATVFRWCMIGIRGHRLEYVQLGGCRVTTEAALQRFFGCLTDTEHIGAHTRQGYPLQQTRVQQELADEGL